MKAYLRSDECTIDYTPASAVSAGDVLVLGGQVYIAPHDIAANALGALLTEGVFRGDLAAVTVTIWDAIYWDADGDPYGGTAGTGCFTNVATGNTFCGYAVAAASNTSGKVDFLLVRANTVYTGIGATIADPGNAGAIPVLSSGHVAIVTAGSETRTLAIPTFAGQEILLYVKTDGGTCVITVASAINQTGNNTITMADVNDSIRLHAVENGSNLAWRVVANDGAALSTV